MAGQDVITHILGAYDQENPFRLVSSSGDCDQDFSTNTNSYSASGNFVVGPNKVPFRIAAEVENCEGDVTVDIQCPMFTGSYAKYDDGSSYMPTDIEGEPPSEDECKAFFEKAGTYTHAGLHG
eukprot:TRINITY_DN793_c0_g1_i2.p2 TRINITY_DN793_c0_g1~~TRINITY_DN793_c0_g1_i2.p2  ORF type:complete len:123 (-),score=21.43 TRINITY_DN793_c0_g1_i2:267-635(-)